MFDAILKSPVLKNFLIINFFIELIFSTSAISQDRKLIGNLPQYIQTNLKTLDTRNPEKLCEAQYTLMLFVRSAFNSINSELRDAFFEGFSKILDQTQTLGELRAAHQAGKIRLEPFLQNPTRSGAEDRQIFPFDIAKQIPIVRRVAPQITYTEVSEQPLCQLQFSYLLAYAVRSWSLGPVANSKFDAAFAKRLFTFLLRQIVVPYWTKVEAWHWLRFYPNMRELVKARLEYSQHPELLKPSYYKAFYDMDFFTMAIAADLLTAVNANSSNFNEITSEELTILNEIQSSSLAMYKQRIEPGPGFLFQKGVWSDHSEYQYSLCPTKALPDKTCPDSDQLPDTNHAERLPWWLESHKLSYNPSTTGYNFYQTLLDRLAFQFGEKVLVWQSPQLPVLNNYFDGKNGWYRVNYNSRTWGYGPYSLTHSAKWGSWSILAGRNNQIKKFNQAFCALVLASDKQTIDLRTKYYGNIVNPDFQGHGTQDDLGGGTIYDHYCRVMDNLRLK